MSNSNTILRGLAIVSMLLLATAGTAFGQAQSGNLYGTAIDNEGSPLPGVTVTVSGVGAPQVQITNAKGEFRFLGLSPGDYSLTAALDGFSTVEYPNIVISVNRNTSIEISLSPAIEETITVTSESPLLDQRKITTGTTVNQVELEKIPSARDPWAVLQTVPGVQTDRVNVGGNESGQQAQYTGPGSTGDDAQWAVDGVVITDMGAIGSSPSYYNFDSFEEMQATTGGSDASLTTGGVTLNMVTRRGTNEWRGSARFIKAEDSWQSGLEFAEGDLGKDFDGDDPAVAQGAFEQGNRIVSVDDWGAEFGGPIVKDKLWIWANYGRNEIDLLTIDEFSDFTLLEDYGGKLNAQITTANSFVFFYNFGDKVKNGRNAGPSRPQLTTWNQTGPTEIWKVEDTHVFSSSFFLTGMVSYVDGGFQLTPQGGVDGKPIRWDENFIWQDNFFHHDTVRPQDQAKIDGNYFFNSGNVSHDLKFGVGYRKVGLESQSLFPGNGTRWDFYGGPGENVFVASRSTRNEAETTYQSLYLQDTLTVGNLTANIGVRYDSQDGEVFPASVDGVPGFETLPDGTPLLQDATAPGYDQPFTWEDVSPRLGVTYALGAERKTLLRASYARFAEQMRQGYTVFSAPLAPGNYSYAYFTYEDLNGDGFVTPNETIDFLGTNGFDPTGQTNPNQVDPNFDAPVTDEIIVALEHALLPEFLVGATITLRNISDIVESERLVIDENGVLRESVASDYVRGDATVRRPTGPGASDFEETTVSIFGFRDGITDSGGNRLTNGDREQDYQGISLFFNKRLSNRWMMRGNFTFQDWEWNVPASEREDPNNYLGGGYDDGGPVLQGSGTGSGSKGGVYINAGWSYSLTGMYQVAPDKSWGFNVSAALYGREGYPIPYFFRFGSPFLANSSINIQATDNADDFSNEDVHLLDLRLEKDFGFENYNFTVGVELFNAFNESTVLQRQHRLGVGVSDNVQEILSPRVWRFGVRFRFN